MTRSLRDRARPNGRAIVLAALAVVLVAVSGAYTLGEIHGVRDDTRMRADLRSAPVEVESSARLGKVILFRHTGEDARYGVVAQVPRERPQSRRSFTGVACERVDATPRVISCLARERGVETRHVAQLYDADWRALQETLLPGPPSRTRLSPGGRLVATTSFVTGHAYESRDVSTATVIRALDGRHLGNLEEFTLSIDGREVAPEDRNIWGVTFVDDQVFYATVSTGGRTHLVRGDLAERTLTSVVDRVECPSLSPDGTRIAFKQVWPDDPTKWTPAVLDLASGRRTVLMGERRSVDDQIEWLDDDTLLYGLARPRRPAVTDVWSLDIRPDARPRRFITRAWSPSVVR